MCFQKAGELCGGRGYDVLAQTGDTSNITTVSASSQGSAYSYGAGYANRNYAAWSGRSTAAWGSQANIQPVDIISRNLLIACRGESVNAIPEAQQSGAYVPTSVQFSGGYGAPAHQVTED